MLVITIRSIAVLCALWCCYTSNAQLISDQEGSGGGSGLSISNSGDGEGSSGYGSGEPPTDTGPPTTAEQCTVSAMSTDNTLIHEEDAVTHMQCRSACITKLLENDTQYQVSMMNSVDDYYNTISDKSLQNNCNAYQKIYECITGCRMGMSDITSCPSNCFDRCETSGNLLPNSLCPVSCSQSMCNIGCQIYSNNLTITQESLTPVIPDSYSLSVSEYSSPYLHTSGAFRVTFNTSDIDSSNSITAFIVKVIVNDTTTYSTMASLNDVLYIDPSLGCSSAQLQFIPVNSFGRSSSHLSINATVHIYGELYPLWPDHVDSDLVQYSITDDLREGYWHHGVVHIEWIYPNRREYLNSFTVQIKSMDEFACGRSINISNIIDVSYTWKAQSPGNGPISDCVYLMKVLSNPHNTTYPGSPEYTDIHVNTTSNPVPDGYIAPVDISCYLKRPVGNFIYYMPRIEWSIPSNPYLYKGVKGFKVGLYGYIDDDNTVTLREDALVLLNGVSYKNSTTLDKDSINESFTQLVHELTVIYEDGYHGNRYLNTSTSTCSFHLSPPPTVHHVRANDMYIDRDTSNLHVHVTWDEVMFGGESVDIYNIYIGHDVQYNYTSSDPLNGVIYCVKSLQSFEKEFNSTFGLSDSNQVVYVQVQSVNFLSIPGEWSDPYIFNPLTSVFQASLGISCGRTIKELIDVVASFQTFDFYISWNITGLHLPGLEYFDVHIDTVYSADSSISTEVKKIDYEESRLLYAYMFKKLIYGKGAIHQAIDHFVMKVESKFQDGYPNRALVLEQCKVDGLPKQPDTINKTTMELREFAINEKGQLNILLDWELPQSYGGIQEYLIYVGTSPLTGNDRPLDYVLLQTDNKGITEYNRTDLFIGEALLEELENETVTWTFYIQVQSVNNLGAVSNWTLPFIRTMDALNINYSSLFVPIPTTTTTNTNIRTSSLPGQKHTNIAVDPYRKLVPVLSSIIPIIFVVVLAIIVVSILLVVAYCQKKKRSKKDLKIGLGKAMMTQPGYVWERYHSDLEKLTLIGEGNFGNVYKAMLKQPHELGLGKKYCEESTTVFVSSLKASCGEDQKRRFANCIEKYKMLAALEHPFFLTFEGCVVSGEPYYVLTEHVENGDLLTFLQNHKKRILDEKLKSTTATQPHQLTSHFHQHPTPTLLYPVDILNYARQISSAMDCLSGIHVVHGDLACRNIYLDQNYNVKVADFGIVANGHREVIYVNGLPIRWFAPEVLTDHAFSISSDVWAFGVTVWEIITLGDFPYQEIRNNDLLKALLSGHRLQIPKNCTVKFYDVISSCWSSSPHQRPSFESLHETFLDLLSQNQASTLLTLDLSQPDKTCTLETLKGAQSPTSIDSAINDEIDFGVAVSKGGKLVSASNPGYRSDSISYPTVPADETQPSPRGGFTNPGFRRSSMKSVDLDSPSIQISCSKPHPQSDPTAQTTCIDISKQIQQLPLPLSAGGHETSSNASTEV